MLEILIATSNSGKKSEIEEYLKKYIPNIKLYDLTDLNIRTAPEEDSSTFRGNSIKKSVYYSSLAPDLLTLADDSGLSVEALNGRPGVNSARFAGPVCDDEENIKKLLTLLSNIDNRKAKFTTIITLALNGEIIGEFIGEVTGIIINQKRGSGGFGYDPIFLYPPLNKTFAELKSVEKNRISHRARALSQLKDFLKDQYL